MCRVRLGGGRADHAASSPWTPGVIALLVAATLGLTAMFAAAVVAAGELRYVVEARSGLPDLDGFMRFEFPTVGRIYDADGVPLVELADERREITAYDQVPEVVRAAILAAEDKRFFAHNGIDLLSVPRVVSKVRLRALARRMWGSPDGNGVGGRAIFPQGGSTITQQLVRGVFLQPITAAENRPQLQVHGVLARGLAAIVGPKAVNMAARKREELRLALWLERQMQARFGSKRRAKEELLARYVSFVYMGDGQYGFARAAEHYFGRTLASFGPDDAAEAALLAGIPKAPRDYAPGGAGPAVLHRRNHVLGLMADAGSLTPEQLNAATRQPLPAPQARVDAPTWSSAVVEHVLAELASQPGLAIEDLRRGRIQVRSTVDAGVQRIVGEALEHGLERYEKRRPRAAGLVQGAVVVLRNRDGAILAEAGGRQVYGGRESVPSDFNRARLAIRQPGSTMKPFVYLAALERGDFTLDTLVPDEPISVPDGHGREKWIENYDGDFRGDIPLREALAESRNAVAVWLAGRVGIGAVLRTSRAVGVQSALQPYPTTALGASEVTLLELATAYRALASGVVARPYVVREVVRTSGDPIRIERPRPQPLGVDAGTLALIQEGLRGVVRMPSGTARALAARAFGIPVMGKTGTTNDFKDALFVGSTYGVDGITVAVRIGFDDGRTLGRQETGGKLALPVFREVMLRVYRDGLAGPVPAFPSAIEQRITDYLTAPPPTLVAAGLVQVAAPGLGAPQQ